MGEDIGIVFDCFLFLSFPLLLSSDSCNMKHSVLFPLLYVHAVLSKMVCNNSGDACVDHC